MRLAVLLLALMTAAPTAALAQGGGLTRVHFARGRSETTIPGRMGPHDLAADYTLTARRGQRMTVRLRSAPSGARLSVIGPDVYLNNADAVQGWTGRLPKSGEYVFRVSAPRPTAFVYTLQVSISALPPRPSLPQSPRQPLAPADAALTGSYDRGKYGDIDVRALPGGRVRFHLFAFAHPDSPSGPNIGEAEGVLTLHGGVGVYVAPEGKGRLLLRFTPRQVIVTQDGASWDLGFGMGVDAAGVYKKNSSRPPKFDPAP